MKALSVRQPFAELIARGEKTIEVRSRRTSHRGPLVICAGAAWHRLGVGLHGPIGERGVTVCVVDVVACYPLTVADLPLAGLPPDFDVDGQFGWVLANPRRVAPVPTSGQLGFFSVDLPAA